MVSILKKSKWLIIVLSLALLLALTMVVLALIPGRQPGRSMLAELIPSRPPAMTVSELHFDIGRNRVFAYADRAVAALGTLGLQVLKYDGSMMLAQPCVMTAPAITEKSGRFLGFDIGGNSLYVFSTREMLHTIETEGFIVSASINGNGWFCVVTQDKAGSSRGVVSVYDSRGRIVYEVEMRSGYVLSAQLSDDNKCLAIINISENGSRVTIYNGIDADKNYPDFVFELGNEIFIDIDYLSKTEILAIGTRSLLLLNTATYGPPQILYNFDGKRLGGYTRTAEFAALHLYDYNIGNSGQVVTIDYDGTVLGYFETGREITSMDSCGNTLMLLYGDGIAFYDKYLALYPPPDINASGTVTGRVLALDEELALAANDLTAIVIRRGE